MSVTDRSVGERHELVETTHVDGVAVIQVNNPPVNALSAGVPSGIASAIEAAEADANVQAIVLCGAGKTFVAGADIKQLEDMAWGKGSGAPNLHQLLQRIEDCSKPVVMAIHGTALGGGLELAMAGHYRVAVQDAQFGQPEVNLGIIPGAEGTQRLPRLAGVEKAIETVCLRKASEGTGGAGSRDHRRNRARRPDNGSGTVRAAHGKTRTHRIARHESWPHN